MAVPPSDLRASALFDVTDRVALVTGGGTGIGLMIAQGLAANGAKVYIASRKEKQLKEVADALNQNGPGSCHYVIADVSVCQPLLQSAHMTSDIRIIVSGGLRRTRC